MLPKPVIDNGVAYYHLLTATNSSSHESTCSINDSEKIVLPAAKFNICVTTGSYRYGDYELQFYAETDSQPTVKKRVAKKHTKYRAEAGYQRVTPDFVDQWFKIGYQLAELIHYPISALEQPVHETQPAVEIHNLADMLVYREM